MPAWVAEAPNFYNQKLFRIFADFAGGIDGAKQPFSYNTRRGVCQPFSIMQFLANNIALLLITIIAAAGLLMPYITARRFGPQVDSQTAVQLINKQNALVVDVRANKDFRKGHIARAVNMPADEIQGRLAELSKERPIVLVDQTGVLSRTVSRLLRGVGFKEVYVLESGLLGWQRDKMPLSS